MRKKVVGGTGDGNITSRFQTWPPLSGTPRGSITNEGPIEFDTGINRNDGSIRYLSVAQTLRTGKRMRVVLNRDDLARMIARINGDLIYVNGEFQLAERPEKSR